MPNLRIKKNLMSHLKKKNIFNKNLVLYLVPVWETLQYNF